VAYALSYDVICLFIKEKGYFRNHFYALYFLQFIGVQAVIS